MSTYYNHDASKDVPENTAVDATERELDLLRRVDPLWVHDDAQGLLGSFDPRPSRLGDCCRDDIRDDAMLGKRPSLEGHLAQIAEDLDELDDPSRPGGTRQLVGHFLRDLDAGTELFLGVHADAELVVSEMPEDALADDERGDELGDHPDGIRTPAVDTLHDTAR